MAKRTTHRSSAGKKLYAVREESGQFKDIQSYARAHRADMAVSSMAEVATAKKAAKKPAKKKAAPKMVPAKKATKKKVKKEIKKKIKELKKEIKKRVTAKKK